MQSLLRNEVWNFFAVLLLYTHVKMLSGLKCICEPSDCELIRQNDCPGKMMVFDACKCCKVCAKVEGEPCGGAGGFHGKCQPPLKCISRPPVIGTGICLNLPPTDLKSNLFRQEYKRQKCRDSIIIEPGCEIVERKCQCWHNPTVLCKENVQNINRWDFVNFEECKLNLAKLIETESDFDEDYTLSPSHYAFFLDKRKNKKHFMHTKKVAREKSYSRP